jgi:HemX protein
MLAGINDRTWLWAAAGFYLVGLLLGTFSLLRGGKPSGAVMYALVVAGYVLQLIGLSLRGRAVGGCPLGNNLEIYQFVAWSAITLYLVIGVTFRTSLLGYFTSCLAAALTLVSLAIPSWDPTQRQHIFGGNPWIELHAALAVFSYGVFGLLALTSFMFLARNHSLKSKNLVGWVSFLPSIIDLDHMGVRLLGTGVTILATSLAVASSFWLRDMASANLLKIICTVAVWAAYASTFGLRLSGRLLARRFAWTCLVLFPLALLSLEVVNATRQPATPPSATNSSAKP